MYDELYMYISDIGFNPQHLIFKSCQLRPWRFSARPAVEEQ